MLAAKQSLILGWSFAQNIEYAFLNRTKSSQFARSFAPRDFDLSGEVYACRRENWCKLDCSKTRALGGKLATRKQTNKTGCELFVPPPPVAHDKLMVTNMCLSAASPSQP